MLPSKQEMQELGVSVRADKLIRDWYEKNKEEFEKGLISGLVDGWECYRTSPEGDVTFISREEFNEKFKELCPQNH